MTAEAMKLTAPEVLKYAGDLLGKLARDLTISDWHVVIEVAAEDLPEVALRLRDDKRLSCKYLSTIIGVDYEEWMETLYMLRSQDHSVPVRLRVKLDREQPEVPSVAYIWSGANWHEREAYDFFGIQFQGHPDLRHILTREDMDSFPLRKDARPHRKRRRSGQVTGMDEAVRLPGEPDRRERS
ncbi:MAG: NADH-quinone oxidoreductase subunit C [Thermoleophilia bacterium]